MISAVNFENAHLHGSLLTSQYKLRHKCFIERQSYNVYSYDSMEYDQYDNPSSVYLVYGDYKGTALGVSRLTPVSHRCMLEDLVPDMVEDPTLFKNASIWEGTRFCVEKDLDPIFRDQITKEIVLAYYEFAINNGISHIIGMMPTYIWKRVLQRNGCDCEILGPVKIIDGQKIQAVSLNINWSTYQKVKEKTGIIHNVLMPINHKPIRENVYEAA